MRFPLSLTTTMAAYIGKKKLTRQQRFPLVLMLEPLHACNLTCTGCGRIREYETTIKEKLSVEECLASVDEAGAAITAGLIAVDVSAYLDGRPIPGEGVQYGVDVAAGIIRRHPVLPVPQGLMLRTPS